MPRLVFLHSLWLDDMPVLGGGGCYLVTDFQGEENLKACHVEKYFSLLKQFCFTYWGRRDDPRFMQAEGLKSLLKNSWNLLLRRYMQEKSLALQWALKTWKAKTCGVRSRSGDCINVSGFYYFQMKNFGERSMLDLACSFSCVCVCFWPIEVITLLVLSSI